MWNPYAIKAAQKEANSIIGRRNAAVAFVASPRHKGVLLCQDGSVNLLQALPEGIFGWMGKGIFGIQSMDGLHWLVIS